MAAHLSHTHLDNGLKKSDKINAQANFLNLTKRETEVLIHIVLGHTAKETGQLLGISFRTVEAYIDTLKLKLGCHSKRGLIEMVIKTGLIFKLGLI